MTYCRKLLIYVLMLFLTPQVVFAATFFAQDTIATRGDIKDDVYAAGNTITIGHEIQGDLVAAGNHVEVTAPVSGDVFSVGESVNISTAVGDDLHVAASRATIRGGVADDVFVAGEYVDLDVPDAVAGDAYIAARTVSINGVFEGSLYIASEQAVIESGTAIRGDLVFSGQHPTVASGVQIRGGTRHVELRQRPSQPSPVARWVFGVVTWFVTGYVLVRLLPFLSIRTFTTLSHNVLRSAVVGILWTLAGLPLAVILLTTLVGIPLSFIFIFGTLLLYVAAAGYVVIALGVWVIETISGKRAQDVAGPAFISWQHVLLGAVLYKSILLVPVVGRLLVLTLTVATAGALLRTLGNLLRKETV